jgi:anti-sigma B factor antagonist
MHDGRFPFEVVSGVPVVTAPEEIDITSAPDLRSALVDAAARGHGTLVVDMTQTQFCDSSGLHTLLAAHRRAQAEGGALMLVISASPVLRIFAVTGIDRMIPSFTSLDQALARTSVDRSNGRRRADGATEGSEEWVTGCAPGLCCLGWAADHLRVDAAHLGQGVMVVGATRRLCLGRLPEQRADGLPETTGIGPAGDHETTHRLACVGRKVAAACAGRGHIDASAGQVSLEGSAVIWRGDHDRHATVLDGGEKVLAHPLGEFLLVPVKQDDMLTAPGLEDVGPGSHGVSCPGPVRILLLCYAASCDRPSP